MNSNVEKYSVIERLYAKVNIFSNFPAKNVSHHSEECLKFDPSLHFYWLEFVEEFTENLEYEEFAEENSQSWF